MFTKLKNKIAEEVKQSPLKLSASVQQLAQAVVSPSSSSIVEPASNDHFSIGDDSEETPQNSPSKSGGFQSVDLHGETPVSPPMPPGGRSRRSSTCSVSSDASSLFPILESSMVNSFTLQSDLESASEVEDSLVHQLDKISKEQLYTAYRKVQGRYAKYKGRYADLARHYRELDRENVKAKTVLVESQDKALRRIAELKEQCQLEQKAKAHLEDALRNDLEEKDHLIKTLYTKIELLRLNGGKDEDEPGNQTQTSTENLLIDLSGESNAVVKTNQSQLEFLPEESVAELKDKIKKHESLLNKCKESIKRNKERVSELTSENQQLQQTLEDTKAANSTQLATLTEDLTGARQEIVKLVEALDTLRKREEDAALSLAENKLTIHRELEAKEEQIKSLRKSLTQLTRDKEVLVGRATSLQNEVLELKSATPPQTEDVSSSEEDRQNLIQELSRGKAEAVRLLQQEMKKKLIDLEMKMSGELQASETKNSALTAEVKALKMQIEEQDKANKELEQKIIDIQKENSQKDGGGSVGNVELETIIKDLENNLQIIEKKLVEKENIIANLEFTSKNLVEEHNKQLLALENKVKVESADRLQAESKLSERDHEIKELNNKHKRQMEEGLKTLADLQSQLDSELSVKSETEKKYKDLLNQMDNLDTALKNKDSEVMGLSSEIVILKDRLQSLELKLKEAAADCTKVRKEKENLSSVLVTSLRSFTQLKSSFQVLRKDVCNTLNSVKDEFMAVGSQMADAFGQSQNELTKFKTEIEKKEEIETKLRENVVMLERELNEQRQIIQSEGNLEIILDELRASKRNLESQLSENNAIVKKLQNELDNTTKTLESKERELAKLHHTINDMQQELTQNMQKANDDILLLRNECAAKLEAKDTEQNELQKHLQESQHTIDRLQNEIKATESKLNAVSKDCERLQHENEDFSNKVKELEEKTESLDLEFKSLTGEKTKLTETVIELTDVVSGQKQENEALNKKLKATLNSASASNNEIISLKDAIEKLTGELATSNRENEVLKTQHEEISKQMVNFSENVKTKEETWSNELKADKENIKKLENSLHSLEKKLKHEKQKFETELSNLNSQLKHFQQREQELLADAKMLREDSNKNKDKGCDYEARIADLQVQLEKAHQMAEDLSSHVENITKESTKQKKLLEQRQSEVKDLITEKESILASLEFEHNTVRDLETKLFVLKEEKEKWSEVETASKMKEKEAVDIMADLREKLNKKAERIVSLEEQYQNEKERNSNLERQLEELSSVIRDLQDTNIENISMVEHLNAEKEALEHNVRSKDNELASKIKKFESEVLNLKLENEKLSKEVSLKAKELEELIGKVEILTSDKNTLEETKLNFEKIQQEKISLEKQLSEIVEEKRGLEQELSNELNFKISKQQEERTLLQKIHAENEELKKQLESALKEKADIEDKLNRLEETQLKILSDQKHHNSDVSDLKKQLDDALLQKSNLENDLKAEIETSRKLKDASSDLEKLLIQKEQIEQQLDNTLLDLQAKEKQVAELEDIHAQKIKQLVRDFEKQLALKNDELHNLEDKKFERKEQEENLQVREYRDQIQELQEASQAQGEAYQQLYLKHEETLKGKQVEANNMEQHVKELHKTHQRELTEVDKRWRQCLEKQLAEAEARHKEELTELSKEWHWERKKHVLETETSEPKELESTSQLAVAAVESGTGSIELLHRQLVAQTNELKEAKRQHRLEVTELRRLLSLRKSANSSDRLHGNSTLEDACTELEYLRNILYEYMMGKEPVVLARVISAVVKFDTDQTAKVLQKEEQKQTLLGQLGIL